MTTRCSVGIDFGSESARALVVDVADGRELGRAVSVYRNGVISERLPEPFGHVALEPEWALQNPFDYLQALSETVPAALAEAEVAPDQVIGVGIDFTSCTMLPTTADGTPLCFVDDLRGEPHAWPKLWKHHAAQPEADRINRVARARGEAWLDRYGGKISAEWFFAKTLQILDEAPHVYARADRLIEAADWIVWQLTGLETRNACTAGYKAMWTPERGFPSSEFFAALDARLADVVDDKLARSLASLGDRAGALTADAAGRLALRAGTPVAVANVDAHVSGPAVGATKPGTMVIIMGTSNCHILVGERLEIVEGMCGVLEGGILPGLYGYEAGQPAVGDIFAWFTDRALGSDYSARAVTRGCDVHELLELEAAQLEPGESGLLALDWWNGNRSILVDAELTGVVVGMTLATKPPEIYRALLEATAFGTRAIIEAFEAAGVSVAQIVACGGLPQRNELLMQIYADVTGRELSVPESSQVPALGAAMFGAVAAGTAAGGYDSIEQAAAAMASRELRRYRPSRERHLIYDDLFCEYRRLHDLLGRDPDSVLKRLWRIRRDTRRATPLAAQPSQTA